VARSTPATVLLAAKAIGFELHTYDYDPDADRIGLQAAEALGAPPRCVLKTLVVKVDGKPACVLLASDREASLKKVAAAFGGKAAMMAPPAEAERLTGYKVGGISPFGQRRPLPTVVDAAALTELYVFVNGGQRGLQIRLDPADLVRAAGARTADLLA